jgi:fructokinase
MIVVCGEALLDVFTMGETRTGLALEANVGGSPFNLAMGLARLGQSVGFFGAISTGFAGDVLLRALQSEGVDTAAVARKAAPTTLSLVGLDAQGVPSYSFYGLGCADRLLDSADLRRLPATLGALCLGSYASVVEPGATALRELVEREKGRSLIAFDPNVRLSVEPDVGLWKTQMEWMLSRVDLLKISHEDLAALYPDLPVPAFAQRALEQGARLVVVTCGALGALAWTPNSSVSIRPETVVVVDTVGAGDTFQAALITWLVEHDALNRTALAALDPDCLHGALTFAARAAAVTCSRRGADMPRRAELSFTGTGHPI